MCTVPIQDRKTNIKANSFGPEIRPDESISLVTLSNPSCYTVQNQTLSNAIPQLSKNPDLGKHQNWWVIASHFVKSGKSSSPYSLMNLCPWLPLELPLHSTCKNYSLPWKIRSPWNTPLRNLLLEENYKMKFHVNSPSGVSSHISKKLPRGLQSTKQK